MSYQVGDLLKDKDLQHFVLLVNEYANVYESSLLAHYTKIEAENGQV